MATGIALPMVETFGRLFGIVGVGFGIFLVVVVLYAMPGKITTADYKIRRLMIILSFSGAIASGVFWLLALLIMRGLI